MTQRKQKDQELIFFVIRQKSTGRYLAQTQGNQSYREFADALPPRLYGRFQDALASARHWVQGHSHAKRHNLDECVDSFDFIVYPVEGRTMVDIEIVPVGLELRV